ncbi:hypothetical protein Sjap_023429 [Stephania japonica]|uniref:PPM-type phosphatase domain-containing protein n=1 Tax=Stephania japonica TaxID=461633 RepID=A0AAP0HMN8_9MAGN
MTPSVSNLPVVHLEKHPKCIDYSVFDGHGGSHAALYIRMNILNFIIEDSHFPTCVAKAIKSAYMKI